MDIKMPGIDAVSASKAMRRQFPELRVILMTAHDAAAIDRNTARIVSKPLDLPALFELLESANEPDTAVH
jgi:DNA-binding NtrC family response regulator